MLQDPHSDTVQKSSGKQGQDVYTKLGLAAAKIAYDRAVAPGLVEIVKKSEDPVQGIVIAAESVLARLKETVTGVHPNTVYFVGPAVISFVAELAEAAGVLEVDGALIQKATQALETQLQGQASQPTASSTQPRGLIGQHQMAGA